METSRSLEYRETFEFLVSKNLLRFRRIALRWLRNHEDAEDVVQDALLLAFKNIERFEGRAQMTTWVTTILINSLRMRLRRRPRYLTLSLDQACLEDEVTISDRLRDRNPNPEESLLHSELKNRIKRLTDNLPKPERIALRMRQADGICVKQAAGSLGIPEGTLKARVSRGRNRLARALRRSGTLSYEFRPKELRFRSAGRTGTMDDVER